MKTLGIDIGSSSVKAAVLDTETGECIAAHTSPPTELPIDAPHPGWAEQAPDMWWEHVSICLGEIFRSGKVQAKEIAAIGITYQMHGLVALDADGKPLRPSIIWCDSRAVCIGEKALQEIGPDKCLNQLLNSPGNFTASKLAWVKANEPGVFSEVKTFMLPGDYILYKLSGEKSTTESGLSEQILWDFSQNGYADLVGDYYGIPKEWVPPVLPNIGIQAETDAETERIFGIKKGTPISFRAGDQPNNAFSLNVMEPGEIAATGGTSGVVYGVTDQRKADPQSRVNTFLHVNHSAADPRYGVLLCINGTGILNAWMKRLAAVDFTYDQVNELSASAPAGSDGVVMLPFGNGAERMLCNSYTGATMAQVDLNRHTKAHVLRATQEGIAFAFRYGMDIMKSIGVNTSLIRAGKANLFLSPLFRETLATIADAKIELYNTDGSLGAARGAALGAGIYKNREEAFASLKKLEEINPNPAIKSALDEAYEGWKHELKKQLEKACNA
ncbi:MAG: carbohydrate kinase [Rikenellaceae bacterium]|jgi:xylulokinase|nr:carbohydrate kinase [Rikenellaceae bacterium]